jgi:tripartite-type tricarboxylate transporter receptor subunit TctC
MLALSLGIGAGRADAETPEQFYKGKTIHWIVGSKTPGSITDLHARDLAPHLERELGARVRIQNRGTLEAINTVFTKGSRDGLTLLISATGNVVSNDVLNAPGVRYEAEEFNYITNISPGARAFQVAADASHQSVEQLRKVKGLKAGATSPRGGMATSAVVAAEVLGLDLKLITGYKGRRGVVLAVQRGEIDYLISSDSAAARDVKAGNLKVPFVISDNRSPALPDVPTVGELEIRVPDELQAAFVFIQIAGTVVALPPGVPQDRVEHMRKVFDKLGQLKEVQDSTAKLRGGIFYPWVPGPTIQEKIKVAKENEQLPSQLDALFHKYTAVR